jgi:hypothetical protein
VLPACDFAPFDEDGVVGGSGWDAEPVEAADLRANEFGRDIVTLLLSSSSWMDDAMRAWANGKYDKVALIAPLALEHLGKAVLWRRNPVLLTPLGDNAEASLMSLATAPSLASPKLRTIGLKQVLERVETVIEGLAIVQGDKMRLVNVRNGATHVGAADASRDVLLDALTLTQTMLADLGVDPATYFGQHSRDVTALLDAKRTEVGHRVLAKRAKARQRIDQLTENLTEAGYMEAAVRLEEQRDFRSCLAHLQRCRVDRRSPFSEFDERKKRSGHRHRNGESRDGGNVVSQQFPPPVDCLPRAQPKRAPESGARP